MPLSKRNRRGLISILMLCLIIAVSPRLLNSMSSIKPPFISHQEAIEEHREHLDKESNRVDYSHTKKELRFVAPKEKFDPNEYQKEDWMKLGLSEKQTEVILKFSKRGLRSAEDLKKIFVLPNELFVLLVDSLYFPKQVHTEKSDYQEKLEGKNESIVSLNSATIVELEGIPGIGPYYAKKIIEYREKLGGYVGKEQLLEIWKFDAEKYNEVAQFMVVGNVPLNKISINSASTEDLFNHPYISYAVANSIVKMRIHRHKYGEIEEIKESVLVDEELFRKLKPYLEL